MRSVDQVNNLADQVVEAIRSVVGPGSVALHEPSFNGNEIEYLTECINSTNVSGYNNGILTTATSVSSTIISPQQIILNSNGNTSNINLAFATVGYGLTATDAGNLHALVQAYQTTLARNV